MEAPSGTLGRRTQSLPSHIQRSVQQQSQVPGPAALQVQTTAPQSVARAPAAAAAATSASAELSGWLWNKGGQKEGGSKKESWRKGKRRNWKKRYFTQTGRTLCYHDTSEDALRRRPPVGRIDLALFELREREPTAERQVCSRDSCSVSALTSSTAAWTTASPVSPLCLR